MKGSIAVVAAATLIELATAFPRAAVQDLNELSVTKTASKRQLPGITPGFNAAYQYVSNTGEHGFVAPGTGDQRGPCPGLNAMANHGYLPHNGIGSISDFTIGCFKAFGMGLDLSGFLAVYGAIFDGNLDSWSIGGPTPSVSVLGGLLGTPQGMSGSHNNYENDASPIRGDLYTYGNDYLNQVSLFEQFYDMQKDMSDDKVNYDLDIINAFRYQRFTNSQQNNPYFWNGPFSGFIASPAAYSFIFRFMANKSAEYPEGRLSRSVLKSFYAITGDRDAFVYTPGNEKFPDNWYKRAEGDEYTIPYFALDALRQIGEHPEFASIGGNTGKVNTFTGIDPGNLTGGIYNLATLAEGNNFECYAFELVLQAAPSLLEGIFEDVSPAIQKLTSAVNAAKNGTICPSLASLQYNQFGFDQFPGYSQSYDGYKGMPA